MKVEEVELYKEYIVDNLDKENEFKRHQFRGRFCYKIGQKVKVTAVSRMGETLGTTGWFIAWVSQTQCDRLHASELRTFSKTQNSADISESPIQILTEWMQGK